MARFGQKKSFVVLILEEIINGNLLERKINSLFVPPEKVVGCTKLDHKVSVR